MTGKLISITTPNPNTDISVCKKISNILRAHNKTVTTVCIDIGSAPIETVSPYIRSLFDINTRYSKQKLLSSKLNSYDYVLVTGYTATSVLNISSDLTDSQTSKFVNWLEDTQNTSYQLLKPYKQLVVQGKKDKSLAYLSNIYKSAQLFTNPNKAAKFVLDQDKCTILSDTSSNNTQPTMLGGKQSTDTLSLVNSVEVDHNNSYEPSKFDKSGSVTISLYELIKIVASGQYIEFDILQNSDTGDREIVELINAHQQICATDASEYNKNISLPLSSKVRVAENIYKISPNENLVRLLSNDNDHYPTSNSEIKIKSNPKNDIELSNIIIDTYSYNQPESNYNQRMRVIETWSMNDYQNTGEYAAFTCTVQTELSLYDIFLICSSTGSIATWKPPTPRFGYVDFSAESNVESLVQKIFDASTTYASIAETKDIDPSPWLLLGHNVQATLHLSWPTVKLLLSKSLIGYTSKKTQVITEQLYRHMSENFPIFNEYYTSEKT